MLDNENIVIHLSLCQDLLRELNEANGNGSIPIVTSTQPNLSVEIGSAAEEPSDQSVTSDTKNNQKRSKEKTPGQGCSLSSVMDASRRAASIFTVENPHNIDRHARSVFPTAFLFVNILYWLYYLFLWLLVPSCCTVKFHHPEAALPPHLRPNTSLHCLDLNWSYNHFVSCT